MKQPPKLLLFSLTLVLASLCWLNPPMTSMCPADDLKQADDSKQKDTIKQTEPKVVLRFVAMSDIHCQTARFIEAMGQCYAYSSSQKHTTLDALIIAGDFTDGGSTREFESIQKAIETSVKPETRKVFCMGNHDFGGGNNPKDRWEKVFQVPGNDHMIINGFHFITISNQHPYDLKWLTGELDKAVADNPRKPIFVVQHYHITPTVYGSIPPDNWGTPALFATLNKYPQVVDFSGHSHYPIVDPRSFWQGGFTAVGTGTLSYFEMEGGKYEKFPKGYREAREFWFVEVREDFSVVFMPYDLITSNFFKPVYTLDEPGNVNTYKYTDARYEQTAAPVWAEGAKADVSLIECTGATITFPQATDDEAVHSYKLEFFRKTDASNNADDFKKDVDDNKDVDSGDSDGWKLMTTRYPWSEYYFNNQPEQIVLPVYDLDADTKPTVCKVVITARDCFGKQTTEPLTALFTMPADADQTIDKTAEYPVPNVIDVLFTEKGPENKASNSKMAAKPIEIFGQPKIEKRPDGRFAALFNGQSDRYKINFTDREYARMKKEVTLGLKFRIEKFEGGSSDPFANTQHGGVAFEIDSKTKELEFWISISGQYTIVSAPIEPNLDYTAYGVYDGENVVLYINGKEVARKAEKGPITYTSVADSRAFCIGSDISSSGGGESYFRGEISRAQFYTYAISAKQVENLSK